MGHRICKLWSDVGQKENNGLQKSRSVILKPLFTNKFKALGTQVTSKNN